MLMFWRTPWKKRMGAKPPRRLEITPTPRPRDWADLPPHHPRTERD